MFKEIINDPFPHTVNKNLFSKKVWNEVKDKSQRQDNMTVKEDPVWDVDMNPGDAIWIPKYYPHLATSATPRMSVSFPISGDNLQERDWVKI